MWIVFAHVATIFVGFALTLGAGVLLTQIVQSGDVRAIRTAVRVAIPTQTAGGILIFAAALIGVLAAVKLGFDLQARWLSISMILVVILLLDGFGRRGPHLRRLAEAAKNSPDDVPSPELRALMRNRFEGLSNAISGLIWLSLLVMMTVKP
jgi:UDP-N-acetylmuramyl pentapeptide phosphotransferase/UDP-N-acetylglucosamine-1-phosphate transferase